MISKIITFVLVNFMFISVKAGYLEINDIFPLGKSYTADASLSLLGGLAQSVRTDGALVTNPATVSDDKFIAFKFNFAGIMKLLIWEEQKLMKQDFQIIK